MSSLSISGIFKKSNIRLVSLFLIIIQSCGIRFLGGQGTMLMLIVILLNWNSLKRITTAHFNQLLFIFLSIVLIYFLTGANHAGRYVYLMGMVVESYVFLLAYQTLGRSRFYEDLNKVLFFLVCHAAIGYLLFLGLPQLFSTSHAFGYPYKTILNLFFVTAENPARNTGLFWEPGLLQLFANLALCLMILRKGKWQYLVLFVLVILSTRSTTGYLCLFLNFLLYFFFNAKRKYNFAALAFLTIILFSGVVLFMFENINQKVGGENISGIIRYRDYLLGVELIKESPIWGHGLFDIDYLRGKSFTKNIESDLFSIEFINLTGEMGGGYTNGLLGLFCWFGIPAALYLIYRIFSSGFIVSINEKFYVKLIIFLIIVFSLISEPISYTTLFICIIFFNYIVPIRNTKGTQHYLQDHKTSLKYDKIDL